MLKDETVFAHNLPPRRILWVVEPVLDDFEDHVIGGKCEHRHDHAACALGGLESVLGDLEVVQEVAVEFGFAVLVVTDCRIKFAQALPGHQSFQDTHQLVWALGVYTKVRSREAEEDGDVVLAAEHRVDGDAVFLVQEGEPECKAGSLVDGKCAADQVSAFAAKKDTFYYLYPRRGPRESSLYTRGSRGGSSR